MNIKHELRVNYRTMIVLAVIVGAFSIALHFMPDGQLLSFMLSLAALGGLISGSNAYPERDLRQLNESYKTAFEWLLLAVMIAYAIILNSRWLNVMEGVALFLNSHWPSLVISMMCLSIGMAGFQRRHNESSV